MRLIYVTLALLIASPAFAIEECGRGQRYTCVVDGDTLWLEGRKLRVAGYDTPESTTNICGGRSEIALARRATARFIELLNTTEIIIYSAGGSDRYGRDLVHITSNGHDVGVILVSEGLARYWPDGPEFWCR